MATALTPSAAQAQYNPAAAATRCRQFTTSERNMRALADNNAALNAFVICIDLGVDPPLKARQEYGRGPAAGVSMAQVSGRTCPPFATCLYGARVFDEVKPGPPAGISRRQLMGAP
ncbi:MAG: hypothetical protein MK052_05175 [Alphaproteobacteria bacterium]|nr:hypothetical protein [Alphaproteobacteria bacterium]